MKNAAITAITSVFGVSTFLFFVTLGITAQATMIGMTALIAWAGLSMVALELRGSILETQRIQKTTPICCLPVSMHVADASRRAA